MSFDSFEGFREFGKERDLSEAAELTETSQDLFYILKDSYDPLQVKFTMPPDAWNWMDEMSE